MKKIIPIIIALTFPLVSFAAYSIPWFSTTTTGTYAYPYFNLNYLPIQVPYITATSTTATSSFPIASSTCFWNGTNCLTSGGTPAGSTGQLQFNNGGVFGATSSPVVGYITATSSASSTLPTLSSTNFYTSALALGASAISYIQGLFTQGTGISISGGTIANTGVLSLGGLTGAIATSSLGFPSYGYASSTYYLASNPSGYTSNAGTVTSITASSPLTGGTITSSGSIGCQTASGSQAGCLSSADWTTFNNKWDLASSTITVAHGGTGAVTLTGCLTGNGTGAITGSGTCNTSNATVSSVAMTTPTGLSVSGSPITTSGTFGLTLTAGYNIPLTASTTSWNNSLASTTALNGVSPITYNGSTGAIGCSTCNTTASNVINVTNSDGTLTISPTTGNVVGSIALGHANTWTALQQFNGNASTTSFTSTGATYLATAGGNVGIGTTSPDQQLSISSGAPSLDLFNSGVNTGTSTISFGSGTRHSMAAIFAQADGSYDQQNLYISSNFNYDGLPATIANSQIAITQYGTQINGPFGLNATPVANQLTLAPSSGNQFNLRVDSGFNSGTAILNLSNAGTTDKQAIYSVAAGAYGVGQGLNFAINPYVDGSPLSYTGADTKLFISPYGEVGIGTQSNLPGAMLAVQGTSSLSTIPLFTLASSTGANLLTVNSNGNVGIGTAAPGTKLEVVGTASSTGLQVNGTATITGALTESATATSTFAGTVNVTAGTIVNNEYTGQATSSSFTINLTNSTQIPLKLGHAGVTITIGSYVPGQIVRIPIYADSVGGATITWDSRILWASSTATTNLTSVAPTLNSAPNGFNQVMLEALTGTSTNWFLGSMI